jgi:peptidoglycan/xylan/chitin deacetylase (PgdA/CDA1 family)
MNPSCYLTIDDSPSDMTGDMLDYLIACNIPALLFIRGQLAENNPEPIIRAIKSGFVIGNHSYAHKPFGDMNYTEAVTDIEKCENIINNLYAQAGVTRSGRYFRFPYLDRGNGDRIERHFETITDININSDPRIAGLQNYLKTNGFTQPFPKTNHPIYNNPSIEKASDCLMTYTSFDWMLTNRHVGKWDYKNSDDLKQRINNDTYLNSSQGNILIFHDQDDLLVIFKTLVDHMISKGYEFLSIQ